jgi:hypothetical protein
VLVWLVGAAQAVEPCRVPGIKNEVVCGKVARPLDPASPGGVQIDIHYVVVPALARNKLPDPVVMLAGGPGQSAAPDGRRRWSATTSGTGRSLTRRIRSSS